MPIYDSITTIDDDDDDDDAKSLPFVIVPPNDKETVLFTLLTEASRKLIEISISEANRIEMEARERWRDRDGQGVGRCRLRSKGADGTESCTLSDA